MDIRKVSDYFSSGDSAIIKKIEHLDNISLRTFDGIIHSNISSSEKYSIDSDDDGIPMGSNEEAELEDHTFNVLLDKNSGDVKLADAFYQEMYSFGIDGGAEVELSDNCMVVHNCALVDGGKRIDVRIEPTPYAGESKFKNGSVETHNPYILGIEVNDDVVSRIVKERIEISDYALGNRSTMPT